MMRSVWKSSKINKEELSLLEFIIATLQFIVSSDFYMQFFSGLKTQQMNNK